MPQLQHPPADKTDPHKRERDDLTRIVHIDSKSKGKFPDVPHKIIPQHPFRMLLIAPQGGGKTNFICNLILRQYKGYFNRIVVCSPTIDNDEKWELVKKTKGVLKENKKLKEILESKLEKKRRKRWKIVFDNPNAMHEHDESGGEKFDGRIDPDDMFSSQSEIYPIIEHQQRVIEYLLDNDIEEPRFIIDRILIILDDQAGMFKMSPSNNPLISFFLKHRHSSTSLVFATQAYKAIPKSIRINFSCLILFEIPNQTELEEIYEEYPDKLDQDTWISLYWRIIEDEPFSFMYFNVHFPAGERIHCRFEKVYKVGKYSEQRTIKEEKISNK
jgi:hypothetical protein